MFSQQSIDDLNIVPELDSAAKVLEDSSFNEEAHLTKMFGSLFTQMSVPEDESKAERFGFFDIATRSQPEGTMHALTRKQLIKAISHALNLKIKESKKLSVTRRKTEKPESITGFDSESIPPMSIESYLRRLADCLPVSSAALILMCINLDTYFRMNPLDSLDAYNVHRLMLVCFLAAHKFIDDHQYGNSLFANVGGVSIREINALERKFLTLIQYQLHCNYAVYKKCEENLAIHLKLCTGEVVTKQPRLFAENAALTASLFTPLKESVAELKQEEKPFTKYTSDTIHPASYSFLKMFKGAEEKIDVDVIESTIHPAFLGEMGRDKNQSRTCIIL